MRKNPPSFPLWPTRGAEAAVWESLKKKIINHLKKKL